MSRLKLDPFRPQDYSYGSENDVSRKGTLQIGASGRGIGSLDIYLPESQYDDIDHTTNRRGEFARLQPRTSSDSATASNGKSRRRLLTVVVGIVAVAAVVIPIVAVWKTGYLGGGDQISVQGAMQNSGNLMTNEVLTSLSSNAHSITSQTPSSNREGSFLSTTYAATSPSLPKTTKQATTSGSTADITTFSNVTSTSPTSSSSTITTATTTLGLSVTTTEEPSSSTTEFKRNSSTRTLSSVTTVHEETTETKISSTLTTSNSAAETTFFTPSTDSINSTAVAATTAISPTSATTSRPPVEMKMFGSETLMDVGPASIICGVTNPGEWSHVKIRHINLNGVKREICKLEKGFSPVTTLKETSISITWNVTSAEIYLLVIFRPAHCQDVGSYYCDIVGEFQTTTAVANVTVKAMPSKPVLTIPVSLVAEQRTEITCTGNVGFPGGVMSVYVKDEDTGVLKEIEPSDGLTVIISRQNCRNHVKKTFPFAPASSGNSTSVVCMVENSFIATDVVRQVSTVNVFVLPAGICHRERTVETVPHPLTCQKFIYCRHNDLTVLTCPDDTCYDATTSDCRKAGIFSNIEAALSTHTSVAIATSTSSVITCRAINVVQPYNLTISHASNQGDSFDPLVSVLPDAVTSTEYMTSRTINATVTRVMNSVSVSLVAGAISCTDSGLYRCLLETKHEKISRVADVKVNAYPTKPKLLLDTDLTVGKTTYAKCTGSVGSPGGKIRWYIKPASSSRFIALNASSEITEAKDCSNYVVSIVVYTPVMAANGSVLRCVSSNDNYPSVSRDKTSDSRLLLILTGTECQWKRPESKISHPYSCSKYIHCSGSTQTIHTCAEGFCFDPVTQRCSTGS